MLPHSKNSPPLFFVVPPNFFVPCHISCDFFHPITFASGGNAAMLCAPVPKAGINKYNRFVLFQNNIRFPKVFAGVLAIAKAEFPKFFAK